MGDNISIITCENPPEKDADGFWEWMYGTYLPVLLEGPTFLRLRIYKEIGEPRKESVMPSAPYVSDTQVTN